MRILVLDDDPVERNAFCALLETLYPQSKACFTGNLVEFHDCMNTDNLVEFHSYLFGEGGEVTPFDKIIIDAQLEIPADFNIDYYKNFLRNVGIDDKDINSNNLVGWKYYVHWLCEKMPERLKNVLIKTGFERAIRSSPEYEALSNKGINVQILNKGDSEYEIKLKKFINN